MSLPIPSQMHPHDSLTPPDREVFDRAVAALALPMTPRVAWLRGKALELIAEHEPR
jgi:hypothetical protein